MLKKILFILLILPAVSSSVYAAQGASYNVGVDGLACPFCAYGIEKQLHKIDGVKQLDVDLKQGVVHMTMQGGATTSKEAVAKAVDKAGFTLRSFEQSTQ